MNLGAGLPTFSIVGLPAMAVKESKERVRAALANSGFEFPAGRISVNLARADLPKEGGRFDLPIALAILLASHQLRGAAAAAAREFYGELSLSGQLLPVRGLTLQQLSERRAAARATAGALARPTAAALALLERVFDRLGLTARSYHRVLRVALTSADLEGSDVIGPTHIAGAVSCGARPTPLDLRLRRGAHRGPPCRSDAGGGKSPPSALPRSAAAKSGHRQSVKYSSAYAHSHSRNRSAADRRRCG